MEHPEQLFRMLLFRGGGEGFGVLAFNILYFYFFHFPE